MSAKEVKILIRGTVRNKRTVKTRKKRNKPCTKTRIIDNKTYTYLIEPTLHKLEQIYTMISYTKQSESIFDKNIIGAISAFE